MEHSTELDSGGGCWKGCGGGGGGDNQCIEEWAWDFT